MAHTPTRVTSVSSDRCQERTAHTSGPARPPPAAAGPTRTRPGAGVGQEPSDLAVLDPPSRARRLALHPADLAPLLEQAGLVHHHHPGQGHRAARPPRRARRRAAHRGPSRWWSAAAASRPGGLPGVLGQLPTLLGVDPPRRPRRNRTARRRTSGRANLGPIRAHRRSTSAAQPSTSTSILCLHPALLSSKRATHLTQNAAAVLVSCV
jgi:hypothetical protein